MLPGPLCLSYRNLIFLYTSIVSGISEVKRMGLKRFSIGSSFFGKDEHKDPVAELVVNTAMLEKGVSEVDSLASSSPPAPSTESLFPKTSSTTPVEERPLRSSIPSSWYTSENFFALETRAIFAQVASLLVTC